MPVLRSALAVLPLAVLATAVAAAPAGAATITTDPCVRYVEDQATMAILGQGFTPGGAVTLAATSASKRTPTAFASSPVLANGAFLATTMPPAFSSPRRTLETFTLVGVDPANPLALGTTTTFQVVRFGLSAKPAPKRPTSRITYTARGFVPGLPVYIHFRFAGATRRTVSLGVAKGPCGIASRRMRALPTRARYGTWTSYTNQSRRFSRSTRPAWKDSFTIYRAASR